MKSHSETGSHQCTWVESPQETRDSVSPIQSTSGGVQSTVNIWLSLRSNRSYRQNESRPHPVQKPSASSLPGCCGLFSLCAWNLPTSLCETPGTVSRLQTSCSSSCPVSHLEALSGVLRLVRMLESRANRKMSRSPSPDCLSWFKDP